MNPSWRNMIIILHKNKVYEVYKTLITTVNAYVFIFKQICIENTLTTPLLKKRKLLTIYLLGKMWCNKDLWEENLKVGQATRDSLFLFTFIGKAFIRNNLSISTRSLKIKKSTAYSLSKESLISWKLEVTYHF